jgi:hypothetical protein
MGDSSEAQNYFKKIKHNKSSLCSDCHQRGREVASSVIAKCSTHRTAITDIGPSVKFMLTGEGERRLARDCKVYGEMDGSLVLHELYQDIDMEDFLMMFPETAKMSGYTGGS